MALYSYGPYSYGLSYGLFNYGLQDIRHVNQACHVMRVRLYIVALQVPAPKRNKQLYSDIDGKDDEETEESNSDSDSRSSAV